MASGHSQFELLRQRRFAPFFATQLLGAFNDNVFRNATIVLITAQLGLSTDQASLYTNLAPALFILPFFLFSALAGQFAEKYEKTRLIRWIKLFEIVAMSVAAWGFYAHHASLLLVVLFLMGLHSTMFGPIKYSILPQALHAGRTRRRQRPGRDRHGAGDPVRHDPRRQPDAVARTRPGAMHRSRCWRSQWSATSPAARFPPRRRPRPTLRINWNVASRNLAHPEAVHAPARGVQLGAGHFVVLVLRHRADGAVAGVRADQPRRRQRAVPAGAGACSRSAPASARCCARSCRGARSRSAWCRWAHSASARSRSTCTSRGRAPAPVHGPGRRRLPAAPGQPARAVRPDDDRRVRRVSSWCRCSRWCRAARRSPSCRA